MLMVVPVYLLVLVEQVEEEMVKTLLMVMLVQLIQDLVEEVEVTLVVFM